MYSKQIVTTGRKDNCTQNWTQMEQTAAIDSPSSAQSGDSAAQSSKIINVLPRSPLLHIPQSVVQTLKMASKSIPIPAKGRMILLNSAVLLNRDALVEASLDAIKQSQEAGVVDVTGDQETPVFEVIQEREEKISVYRDDNNEKTNDIDDVINDISSKFPKSKDQKRKLIDQSISKPKSHSNDKSTSKSHSSDMSTSKSHSNDKSTSKSHSRDMSTSKSHSRDMSTSKSHSNDKSTSKSHSRDMSTSKSHSSDMSTSKSHSNDKSTSKSHSSDMSTSKSHSNDMSTSKSHRIHLSFPKSPHVDSNHSELFHFNTTSSESKFIDKKQLKETFRTTLPIQNLVPNPVTTTSIGKFNEQKSLMLKYQFEKDGNGRFQNNCVENQQSDIRLSKTLTAAELEKHSSNQLTPKTCKESKQNTASQPAVSIVLKDILTTLKVRENDAVVLTNYLKTSSKKVMQNLKNHFPHECRCPPEEQRSVMADQIVLYEERFLILKYLPSITMLLIHGQEMTGLFYGGMLYISVAEIKHKLLAIQGRDYLDIYISEHSSELKYLATDLRNYLMRQGTTRIRLQHEYMITVQSLRKFQNDLHQMQGVAPLYSFCSMAGMDENFYIKKSGQMWCMACLGHMVQESSIDVYTNIESTIAKPMHKDCRDKVFVGAQQISISVTPPGAARTITSPEAVPLGQERGVSSETTPKAPETTPKAPETITSQVKPPEDPEDASSGFARSEFDRTNLTYLGSTDLKSVDKTDMDIIKFGFVIINKTPFTAFKQNNICFLSVYQLLMKQVASLKSFEKHLKRLNTFPRKAPKVVEKPLQQINSIFTNTKWLDTNMLRCVCCMVRTPNVFVNKNLINSIISGKMHENFEYAFQLTNSMENDDSEMATRYSHTSDAVSGQEMGGPGDDSITVTTDQVGIGTVRKALKRSYSCLSTGISTASDPEENKMVEVRNRNHSDVQKRQNSEQSDFSLPLNQKKLKIPFKRRKQKKQLPVLIRKKNPKATISHHSLKQPDLDSQNLNATESMVTATREHFDPYSSTAVHTSTPNNLDNSQIIIKTEPMEYDDEISPTELPTVVIERETVEHEHLQEAVPVGLFPVVKLTRSSSKTNRIPEMMYIPTVTDDPTGNIHHNPSPNTAIYQGDGHPNRDSSSNIDQCVKDEPDWEDNEAGNTDIGPHTKVEPCD